LRLSSKRSARRYPLLLLRNLKVLDLVAERVIGSALASYTLPVTDSASAASVERSPYSRRGKSRNY
jgi:hypothetical protein